MGGYVLNGRGSSRALHSFKDLRHGWEGVPFQNSDTRSSSAGKRSD